MEYTRERSDGCTVHGTMVDGRVDGLVTVTYPSGQTKSITRYIMNVPVGLHEYWKEDGELELTILFNDDGVVIEENGKPVPPGDE